MRTTFITSITQKVKNKNIGLAVQKNNIEVFQNLNDVKKGEEVVTVNVNNINNLVIVMDNNNSTTKDVVHFLEDYKRIV